MLGAASVENTNKWRTSGSSLGIFIQTETETMRESPKLLRFYTARAETDFRESALEPNIISICIVCDVHGGVCLPANNGRVNINRVSRGAHLGRKKCLFLIFFFKGLKPS